MNTVWWLHPGKLTLYFTIPVYLFIIYVVPVTWPHVLVLKSAYYIQGSLAATALGMLALVSACGWAGGRLLVGRGSPNGHVVDPAALAAVGAFTILAYAIWFFPVLLHGQLLLDRQELNQTPGVTSFTQMGIPFVVCYLHCRFTSGQVFPRFVRWELWTILTLTVARVFIWKERLALIEIAVPAALIVLTHGRPRRASLRTLRRWVAVSGPYLAIPALLVMFTVTEYFRSWKTYSRTQDLPLLEFMTSRAVTYYFTALNNGAGMLVTRTDDWPTYNFLFTADWLYRLPGGVGDALYAALIGYKDRPAASFLNNYADPEFNNMSGIFPIVYDLGTVGAGLYFALLAVVAGMLYRSMLRRGKVGGMLYPPVFVGCLEVMRTPYLNGARVILLFVGAAFLLSQMRESRPFVRV